MAKPLCRVLIPESLEEAFLFVRTLLEALDLSLVNPESAKITTWTDDGNQKEISVADILQDVGSGTVHNVQFWKTASEDIFVAWNRENGGWTFSIYLDGVDSIFANVLISKLSESVLTKLRAKYGPQVALAIAF